jgi:hypothetical protein
MNMQLREPTAGGGDAAAGEDHSSNRPPDGKKLKAAA